MSRVSVASLLFAGVGALAGAPLAASAATDLPQEQIAAIGEAGTVYLSGTWSGYVEFPTADGTPSWSDEVDSSFSCSGFIASSDGYVVTAGHCADVAEGKTGLVDQFLSDEVDNGDITSAEAQQYIDEGAENNWPVEGQKTGTPPVLTMKVYPAINISSDDSTSYPAVLQDDRPLEQGDVALFKIDPATPLPVLLVSPDQPSTGQGVDAIGYPGNVSGLVSGNPQPTFSQGLVSGRQQTDGGPFTQIGVTMSPGMSGGPVVNGQGDVVGTVSFGPSGDTQQLNFAAAPETITALLSRNGVKNELSDSDRVFRRGLGEYFSGHFHDAAADLGTVLARDPANAIAQQYQGKAIAASPQEDTSGWVLWVIIAVVVVLVVGVALTLILLLTAASRRRRRAAAAPPLQPYTATAPPQQPYAATAPPQQPYAATAPPQQPYTATAPPQQPYATTAPPEQPYAAAAPPQQPYAAATPPEAGGEQPAGGQID